MNALQRQLEELQLKYNQLEQEKELLTKESQFSFRENVVKFLLSISILL